MRKIAMAAAAAAALALAACSPQRAAQEPPAWEVDDRPAPFELEVEPVAFEVDWPQQEADEGWAEPEGGWAEPPAWEAASAEPAPSGGTDLQRDGVVYGGDGTRYTWYSEAVLPGGGLTELNANGRWTDADGYVRDGDGNLAVASSDYAKGTALDTPWGPAVVYDTGCPSGTVDVYVGW